MKMMKIRWLSLESAVNRVLQQYKALFDFFEVEAEEKNNKKAQKIFNLLANRWNKHYLQLLAYILPIVNARNVEFQSENPKIHEVYGKMESLFKAIVDNYINSDFVQRTDAEFILFHEQTSENAKYWLPLSKVFLGPLLKADLACLPPGVPAQKFVDFRQKCREFYITLATEISNRFPFKNLEMKMLQELEFMDPMTLPCVRDISITARFFNMDIERIAQEFKEVKIMYKNSGAIDSSKFWERVKKAQRGDDSLQFPLISQLIEKLEVLPHSSADCERVFSAINRNKTRARASLGTKTISGILHGKNLLKNKTLQSIDVTPLLKYLNNEMYNRDDEDEDDELQNEIE